MKYWIPTKTQLVKRVQLAYGVSLEECDVHSAMDLFVEDDDGTWDESEVEQLFATFAELMGKESGW